MFPQVGVGAILVRDGAVLLVRRARPPHRGEWAIPGGRVQPGEPLAVAAARELLEETGVQARIGPLLYHFEHIEHDPSGQLRYHYVVLDFAADYLAGTPQAGDDAAEARWVRFDEFSTLPINATTRQALAQLLP